jgi:hypothetical protein
MKLFEKIRDFFRRLAVTKVLKEILVDGRELLNSPFMEVVRNAIPGTADDAFISSLSVAIDRILAELTKKQGEFESMEQKIRALQEKLQGASAYEVNMHLQKIKALTLAELDEWKEPEHLYDSAGQLDYSVDKA